MPKAPQRRHCDAQVSEAAVVASCLKEDVRSSLSEVPGLALAWIEHVTRQLYAARTLIELRNIRSAEDRIMQHLRVRADAAGKVAVEGTLLDVAGELGLTHEAYYRSLAALERSGRISRERRTIWVSTVVKQLRNSAMLFRSVIALAALLSAAPVFAQHGGHAVDHAGHLGAGVMPFDLNRSLHVFTPMPTGGTQTVLSLDGDAGQVDLIRTHLRMEAAAFARGDYADPAAIHGTAMPGLATLSAGSGRVRVTFQPMPQGALIRFGTTDPVLVTALHQWFEAQVRDHGGDAILR